MPRNFGLILQTLSAAFVLTTVAGTVSFAQSVKTSYLAAGRQHPDGTVDAEIEQSIDSQLSTNGLTRTDTNADLIIDYQIAISKPEKWVNYEDEGGWWMTSP